MFEIITDLEALSTPATPLEFISEKGIESTEGNEIINKLLAAMEEHPEIITLAAPQININKRIFCIRFDDQIKTFIDPIITKKSNYSIAPETCASMPGKEILISRPNELTVVYHTSEYKYEENKLLGGAARLFDQQCQLLDGITPAELGLVSDVETDGSLADLSEEEINELTDFYRQYVKIKVEGLTKQIAADPELAKRYKSLSFSEKVINGKAAFVVEDGRRRKAAVNKTVALSLKSAADMEKATRQANLKQFLNKKGK